MALLLPEGFDESFERRHPFLGQIWEYHRGFVTAYLAWPAMLFGAAIFTWGGAFGAVEARGWFDVATVLICAVVFAWDAIVLCCAVAFVRHLRRMRAGA